MVSQKTLERVKVCQKYIDQGMSLRNAIKESHTDIDTYKKYKDLITPQNTDNIIEGIKSTDNIYKAVTTNLGGIIKRKGRPRLEGMKKERINVNLEPKYIEMLKKESEERGIPFATIAASYIVEGLKRNKSASYIVEGLKNNNKDH